MFTSSDTLRDKYRAESDTDQFLGAAEVLVERQYVDDYLDTFSTTTEDMKILEQVIRIHEE